jgi:hypothetical protein
MIMTHSSQINHLDLAFVVDTTGSMGTLIAAAQDQMIAMIDALLSAAAIDLRLAVVEYRDHPPQDKLVYQVHAFTGKLKDAHRTIRKLSASGGGDGPEAVLDGVLAACQALAWRPHARRIAVLVGDAPPHGIGTGGDGFPRGCPCGETIESVTAAAERARITLYALGLTGAVADSFGQLSRGSGGAFFPAGRADGAIEQLKRILADEFGDLEFDQRVLAEQRRDPDIAVGALAERLMTTRGMVAAAVSRLQRRELIV